MTTGWHNSETRATYLSKEGHEHTDGTILSTQSQGRDTHTDVRNASSSRDALWQTAFVRMARRNPPARTPCLRKTHKTITTAYAAHRTNQTTPNQPLPSQDQGQGQTEKNNKDQRRRKKEERGERRGGDGELRKGKGQEERDISDTEDLVCDVKTSVR